MDEDQKIGFIIGQVVGIVAGIAMMVLNEVGGKAFKIGLFLTTICFLVICLILLCNKATTEK